MNYEHYTALFWETFLNRRKTSNFERAACVAELREAGGQVERSEAADQKEPGLSSFETVGCYKILPLEILKLES